MTAQEKANNAIKWIDELLTTKEKQGTNMLGNSVNGYCCLGIGCKVLDIDFFSVDAVSGFLSQKVGLFDNAGSFKNIKNKYFVFNGIKGYKEHADTLTGLNDLTDFNFRRIAKMIIKHLDKLFIPEVAEILIE